MNRFLGGAADALAIERLQKALDEHALDGGVLRHPRDERAQLLELSAKARSVSWASGGWIETHAIRTG